MEILFNWDVVVVSSSCRIRAELVAWVLAR